MSKELVDVKKDGIKSKVIEVIIIIVAIIIGTGIVVFSFWATSNKMNQNAKASQEQSEQDELAKLEAEKEEARKKEEEERKKQEELERLEQERLEAERRKKLPVWTDTAVQDIKDIYSSKEKQIYLTFDDGPSEEITPQILDILREEEVVGTFFVVGKNIVLYPELVKQEYEEGHFIASHGYTHTYSQIYSSVENVYNEYNQGVEAIRNAIGNQEYNPHLFRFPGGSSGGPYNSLKAQAKQYLIDNEVANTNWNCLSSDAAGNNTVDSQYKGVLDTAAGNSSLIILMHDAADKRATPETLRRVIKHYKAEGYEFKNFYEIFKEKPVEETEEVVEDENNSDNKDATNEVNSIEKIDKTM